MDEVKPASITDTVKEDYGHVLNTSADLKTSACCPPETLPPHVRFLSDRSRNRYDAATHTLKCPKSSTGTVKIFPAVSKGSGPEDSFSPSTRSR